MQLDTHTALFVSASILTAVGSAVLFFSSIKKENRFFIWAAIAAFGFAGTLYLMYFRGRISDFFSIVVANELGVICLTSFFESFRYLINVRSMERFAGPLLLVIQPMFISWYTYYEPNFSARVFIASITFCIMCFCIAKLLLTNMMKNQASLRILTSIPFIFMFIFSIIRIFIFIFGKEFPENSLESSAFAMSTAIYGIIAVWTILCLVFMVSNSLQNQVAEMALADPLTGTLNRRALRDTAEREIARSKRNATPLSLIIADLDHFKKVNDIYGHQAGDAILIHVVAQYKKILRSEDVLARYWRRRICGALTRG